MALWLIRIEVDEDLPRAIAQFPLLLATAPSVPPGQPFIAPGFEPGAGVAPVTSPVTLAGCLTGHPPVTSPAAPARSSRARPKPACHPQPPPSWPPPCPNPPPPRGEEPPPTAPARTPHAAPAVVTAPLRDAPTGVHPDRIVVKDWGRLYPTRPRYQSGLDCRPPPLPVGGGRWERGTERVRSGGGPAPAPCAPCSEVLASPIRL